MKRDMSELSRILSTLTTEAANPEWSDIDTWPTSRLVAGMIDADRGLYEAVAASVRTRSPLPLRHLLQPLVYQPR